MNLCEVHKDCEDPAIIRVKFGEGRIWMCLRAYEDYAEGKVLLEQFSVGSDTPGGSPGDEATGGGDAERDHGEAGRSDQDAPGDRSERPDQEAVGGSASGGEGSGSSHQGRDRPSPDAGRVEEDEPTRGFRHYMD